MLIVLLLIHQVPTIYVCIINGTYYITSDVMLVIFYSIRLTLVIILMFMLLETDIINDTVNTNAVATTAVNSIVFGFCLVASCL